MLSDTDSLIKRAVKGDSRSLETLLIHFHNALLQEIKTLLSGASSRVEAEDVLQDVMIEVFRRIGEIEVRGTAAFWGWLKLIARTRTINRLQAASARKRGGRRVLNVAESIWHHLAGEQDSPSLPSRKRETLELIRVAMEQMEDGRKTVLAMRYRRGMDVQAIAKELGKSEGAISMLISRAIQDLRQSIGRALGNSSDRA